MNFINFNLIFILSKHDAIFKLLLLLAIGKLDFWPKLAMTNFMVGLF